MKRIILLSLTFFALFLSASAKKEKAEKGSQKIQVAILLDTSGSMHGLIDQAKSRLWNIVNTLTTLKYDGKTPHIEIALYEYGSYHLYEGDYIRQIVPLTTDLDRISHELFILKTGGSEEYCGTVIHRATEELEWGNGKNDMKLVYIAGNEIFEQGKIPYRRAIKNAVERNIYVNTIHCGDQETGIKDLWLDAAEAGQGKFFNIDHNIRLRHFKTPFDPKIIECNERLNSTYYGYGQLGAVRKETQAVQDRNAMSVSVANYAERSVTKAKSIYKNVEWDLVDLIQEDENALTTIRKVDLPEELQEKSIEEIKVVLKQKEEERKQIQAEISRLAKERQQFIDEQMANEETEDDLGKAITESILAFAKEKGYQIEQ